MWYFAWVLGLGFAIALGILNALWYELIVMRDAENGDQPPRD